MKRGLVLLLTVCALAAAMVPRERRAVNTEEDEERLRTESASNTRKECAHQTPCKWVVYNKGHEQLPIVNEYCDCNTKLECMYVYDDSSTYSYVYYCREPVANSSQSQDS